MNPSPPEAAAPPTAADALARYRALLQPDVLAAMGAFLEDVVQTHPAFAEIRGGDAPSAALAPDERIAARLFEFSPEKLELFRAALPVTCVLLGRVAPRCGFEGADPLIRDAYATTAVLEAIQGHRKAQPPIEYSVWSRVYDRFSPMFPDELMDATQARFSSARSSCCADLPVLARDVPDPSSLLERLATLLVTAFVAATLGKAGRSAANDNNLRLPRAHRSTARSRANRKDAPAPGAFSCQPRVLAGGPPASIAASCDATCCPYRASAWPADGTRTRADG